VTGRIDDANGNAADAYNLLGTIVDSVREDREGGTARFRS